MRKADVQVGAKYSAKVSGTLTVVRIDGIRSLRGLTRNTTGWYATNLKTGREVMIRSAAKLRSLVETVMEVSV